jgi:CheY-like chemotaxis protein
VKPYKRILLVEDDPDDREFFLECLKKIAPKTQCLVAGDGYTALDILQKRPPLPDLIFIDALLPLMDGYQLLVEIKQDLALMQIPVVVLSTSDYRDPAFYILGANVCISKPSSIPDLRHIITEILNHDVVKDAELLRDMFRRER